MKINIYYGGRGLVEDPTIVVLDKMQAVLEELNVSVERFNLYEMKNALTTLPLTLKAADGIILATTVEWFGIGGYMQSFLDAIWMYGDKDKIHQIYMCPVVMSTTYGEQEAIHQNPHGPAHIGPVNFLGDPVLCLHQPVEPAVLFRLGRGVRHFCRRGALAG